MHYGYLAILVLMALEAASLPIPSEVILPVAGYFIAQGTLTFLGVLVVALVGEIIGMSIDYFIAYYLNKAVVYKHLGFFHLTASRLDAFDRWFQRNGSFAVFSLRLVPIVRGLISFPAGFAKMPKKQFYFYSILGSLIWNMLLIGFGYYALSQSSIGLAVILMAVLGVFLYIFYEIVVRKIRKRA